jgi:serine/threonine protein kinase/DNA-binding winged helix-turn-helix (wHTH) protein
MDFSILGPLCVCTDEGLVTIRSARQRSILAVLILNVGRVVSADRLLDLVWGDTPPSSGARSLQFHVWKLRNALDPQRAGGEGIIGTQAPGYVLLAEPGDVDAVRFERMTAEAHDLLQSDPARSERLIQEAMGLWRGPALDDLAYEEFARLEIIRLEQLRQRAEEDRIEAALALGDHDAVVGELAALTAQHPLRERLWGQYMVALARGGRQADALAAYQDLARHLGDQLGIDPSAEVKAIEERILLQDPQILQPGRLPLADRLRGYTLRTRLGEGAFGEVWLAVQPGIGRDVAVKVIRPELANRPEFVLGFEAEARVLASLEHPNIVPLFDFWRDPNGAYLVMPLMRGGSLARAARDAPLAPEPCLSTVAAIADALAYAHRRQVVHGDLTPENVLLDGEGRPYLADFGIASLVGGVTGPEETASGFRSPEQLSGEAPTPRSDVFGLGMLAYLLLTGNQPPPGEPLPPATTLPPELVDGVDGVLAVATAPDPTARYEGPEAFVAALSSAFGAAPRPLPSAVARNPYKGLCAFSEADAADFFGRAALAADLTTAIAHHRLVGVVGPSGCGKSSLVRAGLIPSLRNGAVPGSERWLVADLSPGAHPMAELEAALLGVAARHAPELRDILADSANEPAALAAALVPDGSEVLLLVDQLEELFTLTESEAERRRFIDFLTLVAGDPRSRIRVVVTLRADFYDRPLEFAAFGEMLGRGLVSVATPSEASLALAVSGPAAGVGVTLEPGLETEIARDVCNQPGGLPLMEYALTELFGRRSGAQITTESYHAMGGVTGALGRRAEELYARYDEGGRASVRQIFLRLVQVGEDTSDTRRRVPRHELTGLGIDTTLVDDVLGSFGAHRLLTFDRDPTTRSPTVEVAHEALLTRWDRLRGWVEERRDDLVLHRRLTVAVNEWLESGRDAGYLLTGGRLEHFEQFAGESDLALSESENAFLRESRQRADEEAARRRRRRRAVLGGFAAAAVVASLLAVLALIQRTESNRNAILARSRELAASAIAVADTDPELSLLLALESAEGGEPIFETVTALHQAVLNQRALRRLDGPEESEAILTPDGSGVLLNAHDSGTGQMYGSSAQRPRQRHGADV